MKEEKCDADPLDEIRPKDIFCIYFRAKTWSVMFSKTH